MNVLFIQAPRDNPPGADTNDVAAEVASSTWQQHSVTSDLEAMRLRRMRRYDGIDDERNPGISSYVPPLLRTSERVTNHVDPCPFRT